MPVFVHYVFACRAVDSKGKVIFFKIIFFQMVAELLNWAGLHVEETEAAVAVTVMEGQFVADYLS